MVKERCWGGQRRGYLLVVASVAFVLLGASAAWACVPQANVVTLQPRSSGPAGSDVTVIGVGLDSGPAEVRWNAVDGPLLGKGDGPNVSVQVRIPEVSAGLYTLVVVSRQPGGGIGNTATSAFQVTARSGATDEDHVAPLEAVGSTTSVAPSVASSRSAVGTSLTLLTGAGLLTLGIVGGTVLAHRGETQHSSEARER